MGSLRFGMALLIAVSPVVAAQSEAPTRSFENDPKDIVQLLNGVSRCFARGRPEAARTAMGLPLFSDEQNAFISRSFYGRSLCLDGAENLTTIRARDPRAFVAGLAEGLFLDQHAKADAATLTASTTSRPRNAHEDLALCIVRRDPGNSRALVDTVPGSDAEANVVRKLVPTIGPCVNQGLTLKLNRPTVRAYTAAGLYLATAVTPGVVNAAK